MFIWSFFIANSKELILYWMGNLVWILKSAPFSMKNLTISMLFSEIAKWKAFLKDQLFTYFQIFHENCTCQWCVLKTAWQIQISTFWFVDHKFQDFNILQLNDPWYWRPSIGIFGVKIRVTFFWQICKKFSLVEFFN